MWQNQHFLINFEYDSCRDFSFPFLLLARVTVLSSELSAGMRIKSGSRGKTNKTVSSTILRLQTRRVYSEFSSTVVRPDEENFSVLRQGTIAARASSISRSKKEIKSEILFSLIFFAMDHTVDAKRGNVEWDSTFNDSKSWRKYFLKRKVIKKKSLKFYCENRKKDENMKLFKIHSLFNLSK